MSWETMLSSTTAYCPICKSNEFARIVSNPNGVFMVRQCPKEPDNAFKLSSSVDWYLKRVHEVQPLSSSCSSHRKPVSQGCPKDCGLCEWHAGSLHLPVFSITNDCNLDCPICFTFNRPDSKYYKPLEDVKKIIDHVKSQNPDIQLVNITGGEPTLHPDILDILKLIKEEGIERITMNTNGIKLSADRAFAQSIKELGVQCVLSLDTFEPEKSKIIHGKDISSHKQKALAIFEELDIPITILSVMIKELNEEEVSKIVNHYITKPFVKSITIQNMTYTGKNGSNFGSHKYITIDEVENALAIENKIKSDDFFALASYHPLCYSVAYYLFLEGKMIPLTKIFDQETLREMSMDNYILQPKEEFRAKFQEAIGTLWANGEDEEIIAALKSFIKELYPSDRELTQKQREALIESKTKMLYIHPHMDENCFDLGRVNLCGDLVPDESGDMIPACSYNLFYRQKDERFWVE